MKKTLLAASVCSLLPLLSACGAVGEKTLGVSAIYGAMAALSLLLLVLYVILVCKKALWFSLLLCSVLIVNAGYFALSISETLGQALLSNRVCYLGSVFLPMSMLLLILQQTDRQYKKWLPAVLTAAGMLVFLVAASPGYLDIYYREVTLQASNGATVLEKVYGPWHKLYLFYLLLYFAATVAAVSSGIAKRRTHSGLRSAFLAAAVFINIGVWLLEQLVRLDFELLSVSYNVSVIFLLCMHLLLQETEKSLTAVQVSAQAPEQMAQPEFSDEQLALYRQGLCALTQTERKIYGYYMEHRSTKEVLSLMNITENTLKYHNKNIYSKLGVSSRKQLIAMGKQQDT